MTGAGIGGEYAAINSAIDELIPAHYRGRVDIVINGSFWVGAVGGALLTIPLLDPTLVNPAIGWRLAFDLGAVLAVAVLLVRRNVPESPRWLFIHGREREGDRIVADIEEQVRAEDGDLPEPSGKITIRQRRSISMALIARTVFTLYPRRTMLCFALFIGQAFLYNAFFFTYGDTLTTFRAAALRLLDPECIRLRRHHQDRSRLLHRCRTDDHRRCGGGHLRRQG